MIKHERGATPEIFFDGDVGIDRLKNMESQFYEEKTQYRKQKRSRTIEENRWLENNIQSILENEFLNKCAFCEQRIDGKALTFNNHRFRPKRFATNLDGKRDEDHYFWYLYEWENLYSSCQFCHEHKSNFFPVDGKRADSRVTINEVDQKEKRMILDPCVDDPEEHFYYDSEGRVFSVSEKGANTIEVFQLNRPQLVEKRIEVMEIVDAFRRKPVIVKSSVQGLLDEKLEFLGLRRYLVKKYGRDFESVFSSLDDAELKRILNPDAYVSVPKRLMEEEEFTMRGSPHELIDKEEKILGESNERIAFVELNSVRIKNFKNINDLFVEFPKTVAGTGSWSLFLGENGSGKSSILQAITLALIGEEARRKLNLDPERFLQRGKKKCVVQLETNERTYELIIRKTGIEGTREASSTFVMAYGSTRLMASYEGIKEDRIHRIKPGNLFDPTIGLVDAKKWLLSVDKETFDLVAVVLKEVLGLTQEQESKGEEGSIFKRKKDIFFQQPNLPQMELHSLSDGYKILIALVCDICRNVNEVLSNKPDNGGIPYNDFEEVHGIIVIDELGTHLHPRWKMRIVSALRKAFRRMRFLVSSHEPLCLRGLKDGEVMVVEYENSEVTILEDLPDPSNYRVDQLLSSPFFGLYSVVDPKESAVFYEYYALLRKGDKITPEEAQRLSVLSKEVRKYNVMGNTLREELAYYAVDRILAEQKENHEIEWEDLKNHAKEAVEKLWKEYESDF